MIRIIIIAQNDLKHTAKDALRWDNSDFLRNPGKAILKRRNHPV